jgi:hypothetical protein
MNNYNIHESTPRSYFTKTSDEKQDHLAASSVSWIDPRFVATFRQRWKINEK